MTQIVATVITFVTSTVFAVVLLALLVVTMVLVVVWFVRDRRRGRRVMRAMNAKLQAELWAELQPEPPQSVWLVMADGRELPVECLYEGWDGEAHMWRVVPPAGEMPASLRLGALPPRTKVAMGVQRGGES